LYGAPEPTVALFWNEMAPSSGEDREYFQKRAAAGRICLDGPIPGPAFEEPNDVSEDNLAMQLLELPRFVDPNGSNQRIPYQLVHVAAHSESGLPGITGSTVLILGKLTKGNGLFHRPKMHYYPIKSGNISYLLNTISDPMLHGPVGVLSSCHSTTWADKGMLGLVVPLLQAGYRSVVGFDAEIPGVVAHKLLAYAYDLMFDRRIPLGAALSQAKAWMLLDLNNPLGILLRTYGQIDLSFGR
jgi:CHAT domain-containing protein